MAISTVAVFEQIASVVCRYMSSIDPDCQCALEWLAVLAKTFSSAAEFAKANRGAKLRYCRLRRSITKQPQQHNSRQLRSRRWAGGLRLFPVVWLLVRCCSLHRVDCEQLIELWVTHSQHVGQSSRKLVLPRGMIPQMLHPKFGSEHHQ